MFKKVWMDYTRQANGACRDAGLTCPFGTFLGSMLEGDEQKESVPDPALLLGRFPSW
jgi:hypothetical protein